MVGQKCLSTALSTFVDQTWTSLTKSRSRNSLARSGQDAFTDFSEPFRGAARDCWVMRIRKRLLLIRCEWPPTLLILALRLWLAGGTHTCLLRIRPFWSPEHFRRIWKLPHEVFKNTFRDLNVRGLGARPFSHFSLE